MSSVGEVVAVVDVGIPYLCWLAEVCCWSVIKESRCYDFQECLPDEIIRCPFCYYTY